MASRATGAVVDIIDPNELISRIDLNAILEQVDIEALAAGRAQAQPAEGFALYRVGDAVASRDIAAAIYEARRLCQAL